MGIDDRLGKGQEGNGNEKRGWGGKRGGLWKGKKKEIAKMEKGK